MTQYPSSGDSYYHDTPDSNPRRRKRRGRECRDCCDSLDCCPVTLLMPFTLLWRTVRALPSTPHDARSGDAAQRAGVRLIRAYQRGVSQRRTVAVCRSTPSCSAYGIEAIERHGLARGCALIARRVRRCRVAGVDPVPD